MPTFFFDVWAEGRLYPDSAGVEVDTLSAARQHALRLIARIIRETPVAYYDWSHWSVTIAGGDGTSLATIPFATTAATDTSEDSGLAPRKGLRAARRSGHIKCCGLSLLPRQRFRGTHPSADR